MIKTCEACKKPYKTYPSLKSKYCSKSCGYAHRKQKSFEKYKQECGVCGKEFLPARQAAGGKYCSYKCSGMAGRYERVARNGYWYVYSPDHPKCNKQGYYPVHRLVVEEQLGRILDDDELVHHIDHDTLNNDPSNLQAMTKSEHSSLHMKEVHQEGKIWTPEFRKRHRKAMLGNYKCRRRREQNKLGSSS